MKIALVQCPSWGVLCPPYGIAVLSGYLKNKGHKVITKDLNIELYLGRSKECINAWNPENHLFWIDSGSVSNFILDNDEIIDKQVEDILRTEAKIIGFSIHFSSEHFSKEMAKRIKEKDSSRIIVFGGPQASRVNSGFQLAGLPYIDFVVQGEGELTLADLASRLENGQNIDFCEGVLLKKEGQVIDCGDRSLILNLDVLPFADFGDFDFLKYLEPLRLPISFSRGCPNRCIFCNERPYWRRFRARSAGKVFEEIKYHINTLGKINHIDFHDSLINGNARELGLLSEFIISEKLEIRWGGQVAISKEMTYDLLLKMKKAGCVSLNYGLETGSQRLMQKIGKFLAKDADIDQIIQDTHNVGIDCILNFMFGFPEETEDDFQETLKFISRNSKYIDMVNPSPGFCAFDKGSYVYQNPDEFEIVPGECGALWESKDGTNNYATRLEKFERFLRKIAELGVKSFYPYVELKGRDTVLGHYYFTKRNFDQAITHLNEATKQDPKNEPSWVYLAKSCAYTGNMDKAKKCFDEISRLRFSRKDFNGVEEILKEARSLGVKI